MEDFEHGIISAVGSAWLGTLITAVVIIVITAVVGHLLTKFLRRVLNYSDELPSSSIFINIGRAIVWVVGGSVVLSTCFGVDVSAAITALGIGGIAISLGFQDTISNLIGGVQVSLLRIVSPGDNISVGGAAGVVKDVNWRHTTITNSKGEMVVIPNSIINKTSLVRCPWWWKAAARILTSGPGASSRRRSPRRAGWARWKRPRVCGSPRWSTSVSPGRSSSPWQAAMTPRRRRTPYCAPLRR